MVAVIDQDDFQKLRNKLELFLIPIHNFSTPSF